MSTPKRKTPDSDAGMLRERFAAYMATCRHLQAKYADEIRIYVGFETEDCSGSLDVAKALIDTFSPDYVVGSVHHVKDIPFDYSKARYEEAADCCGGLDGLYAAYFDQQYEMIGSMAPRPRGGPPGYRSYIRSGLPISATQTNDLGENRQESEIDQAVEFDPGL